MCIYKYIQSKNISHLYIVLYKNASMFFMHSLDTYIRIETGSGQLGHILSRSSGSDSVYKISKSDSDSACALMMTSNHDQSN